MAISYEPGDEILLDVESKRKFYTTALSCREQKDLRKLSEKIKELETEDEQITRTLEELSLIHI